MSITYLTQPVRTQLPTAARITRLAAICVCSGLLAACAHKPTMYSWESYQPAVYDYLQGDEDPAAKALAMEKNIETARASNKALPPGFHAHLGLLYLQQGKDAQAMEQIQSERAAFPESTPFMDFLLRQNKEADKQGISKTTASAQHTSTTAPARSIESTKAEQPS